MKKAALIFLTILVATTAMAQKPNHKLTDAERHAIQRYNDSLAVIADRNQLRADIQYRDFLLADSSQLRRLTPAEVRLFIDTQVTQSRTMLYMEEQWFRQNYGVSCGGVDEAYKQ